MKADTSLIGKKVGLTDGSRGEITMIFADTPPKYWVEWFDPGPTVVASYAGYGTPFSLWTEERVRSALSATSSCNHDFETYTGFTETYRFCKRCDAKDYETK